MREENSDRSGMLMEMLEEHQKELNTWLIQTVQGGISPEDQQRLEQHMASDPEILAYCQDFFITCAGLERIMQADGLGQWRRPRPLVRTHLLKWTCAIAATILIVFFTSIALRPQQENLTGPTAQLIDSQTLRWSQSCNPGEDLLFYGTHSMEILEGFAKFRMGNGAQITLKGPCRFTLEAPNRVQLEEGMITAHVPRYAKGFEVITQHARIVDLGTDFGVLAWDDGRAEAQVFSGRVDVWAADRSETLHLNTGNQAIIDSEGESQYFPDSQTKTYYVQHLPHETSACPGRRLDLADIIGGGNGFGYGVLDQGLNPLTGEIIASPTHTTHKFEASTFTPVTQSRYIDGVFLPDGHSGPVLISTADHVFQECPATHKAFYDGIFNGIKLFAEHMPKKIFQGRLNGVTYGTYERPAINCHPNIGVTFDLEAIRQDNPGIQIEAFTSLCGINDIAPGPRQSGVNFWVLLDGQVQVHHYCDSKEQETGQLKIALSANTRFLTLATTADQGIYYCWAFFAEPTLLLAPPN